mgnify:FL=1
MPESESPILTIKEAAEYLRISRSLAYAAARRGELPIIRVGRRLLVSRERLDALVRTAGSANGVIGSRKVSIESELDTYKAFLDAMNA